MLNGCFDSSERDPNDGKSSANQFDSVHAELEFDSVHAELETAHKSNKSSTTTSPDPARIANVEALCRALVKRVGALEAEGVALRGKQTPPGAAPVDGDAATTPKRVGATLKQRRKNMNDAARQDGESAAAVQALHDVLNDEFDEATTSSYYAQVPPKATGAVAESCGRRRWSRGTVGAAGAAAKKTAAPTSVEYGAAHDESDEQPAPGRCRNLLPVARLFGARRCS
jgi:hypothetical protein